MTYQQTIDYLYRQLPMFTRIGAAAYKKDLHNTLALLDILGHPHHRIKTIHIAGTNGKGSSSHMLAAILQHHGYKTGLYTSPHLVDFRERIKINGEWIDADFVVDFTQQIKTAIETIEPSFFEVTVAMAFAWFAQQEVDIAVIETGLGGRLDSTNVITPELSIITNIGWDHMNLLGNTLEAIATEKAGIIKPGIPVVIGETLPETAPVFAQKALSTASEIMFAEQSFTIEKVALQPAQLEVLLQHTGSQNQVQVTTDLPGLYQQYNLRTVLTAVELLTRKGWPLQPSLTSWALKHVKTLTGLQGRWQVLRQRPYVVLDVAHNEQGIAQVLMQLDALQQQATANATTHFIIGMVKDKDIQKVLSLLPRSYQYYFTQAQLPRALPATELQAMAATYHLAGPTFNHVNDALTEALQRAAPQDTIMVCGSVFVVGEVDTGKMWDG
jgi:dihydrofolate synthase/folylpolyglutamate synthase